MRILYATGSPASYMAPPRLSLEQINCGPDWLDADIGGYVTARNTPLGDYDLAAIAAKLPADQQPEAVVCLVDASWRSTPRNLSAFRCPKILLVADTHHLNTPISGMIRYAQHEGFDRIVLLYDRHHAEFFQAAGLKQLLWFPGLTFPHDDRAVAAARNAAAVESRIAFVGQTGICHPRRIQMLSQLHAHNLPLSVKAMSQREGLGFYGSSLVGFNSSLNGDLNLRVFEILASGAMLLTDELAPASGLTEVWQNGRDLVTYASSAELVEKARHAIAHSAETKAIGAAGAKWFDTHFSEQARRTAFEKLVSDGTAPEIFRLPTPTTASLKTTNAALQARLIAGYEYVQELHRNLDRVVIALDESVPEEFARHCATLPRVEVKRGPAAKAGRVDVMVIGRLNFNSPALVAGTHVWAWEDVESERVNLVRRCSSMGLALVRADLLLFSRQKINTHTNDGAVALVRLEQGGYEDALNLARKELEKNPRSADAMLVMLELAQEKGNGPIAQTALAKLREIAPHHPRLQQLAIRPVKASGTKRGERLMRVARSLLEQQKWVDAGKLAQEVLTFDAQSAEAHFVLGCMVAHGSDPEQGVSLLGRATQLDASKVEYWRHLAAALQTQKRTTDALAAMLHLVSMAPDIVTDQLALVHAALEAGHGAIACEALSAAAKLQPDHPLIARWLPAARQLALQCNYEEPRDLLLSHVEVTRLQGTGVLIERFFPDSSSFITIRSRTLYKGVVNFGGVHFSIDLPGLSECARTRLMQRLLSPYRIRRILAVPFFASDFIHAHVAQKQTGAPLCTYVMDDQTLHASDVPEELVQRVLDVSDVRLAISPEMRAEYSAWFHHSFGLLPPIVTTTENVVPNHWTDADSLVERCAMVGNIWSAKQFEQLRAFTRAAKLKVDWFGNANVAWLPKDHAALERDGIFCRGFLPEAELARKLATYPFVVLPSGSLDGTEDNEWLTRLSLPSRMVFILTKTFTPMLVLGSAQTAAAAFVNEFGLGISSNYDATEASDKIAEITAPVRRGELLANARRVAACFLVPDCGEWIWRSLASKCPQPTPFDQLYEKPFRKDSTPASAAEFPVDQADASFIDSLRVVSPVTEPTELSAHVLPAGQMRRQKLDEIVAKLGDYAFLDTFLPVDEPRQKSDVRGGVLYLHSVLPCFGSHLAQLLAVERVARRLPHHRSVLVTWAELLEKAGDLKSAAEKARKALSFFYDDVYTQTLFMRCAGEVNHHANGKDLFCARPFQNFEVYEDGSVHVCNCTCVPFPVGNAITQTADEIWQSPVAKAIRSSILDGSFRYCSPMTCPWRFELPKRAERRAEFEHLQRIGIDGTQQKPKHLNLSYDRSCNLSCPSCRNQLLMANKDQRDKNDRIRDRVVMPLMETADTAYITGSGDAFGSPHFRGILKQLCDPRYKVDIYLGTNGQLITPRLWQEFEPLHARFRDITISIDGATSETFERLRRGSSWEKLQVTMEILRAARVAKRIRRLKVNMVVQTDNFMEMRPLLALCKAWAVDAILFYRLRQWGNIVPNHYLSSDIVNPLNPRHPELLEELAHPDFDHGIIEHYDMYELIARAQTARKAAAGKAQLLLDAPAVEVLEPVGA